VRKEVPTLKNVLAALKIGISSFSGGKGVSAKSVEVQLQFLKKSRIIGYS
jgi:hypothetical protein